MEGSSSATNLIATTTNSSVDCENDSTVEPADVEVDKEGDCEEVGVHRKAPCVVCFVTVEGVVDRSRIFEPVTQEEVEHDKVFQWFLINFRVQCKKRRKGFHYPNLSLVERFDQFFKTSVGWDGEGGRSPPLPLCGECKGELIGFMEKKHSLEIFDKRTGREEEGDLEEGIKEFKRKMRGCEGEFVQSGIYAKDKRYNRVRRYIMKIMYVKNRSEEEVEAVEVPQGEEKEEIDVPCVVCCTSVKIFPKEVTENRKEENRRLFKWFLTQLQNPSGQQLYGTRVKWLRGEVTGAWDGKWGMSEPLQFCEGCREPMMEWRGVRNPLVYKLKLRGIRETRIRMEECEDKFVESGIYERDQRYFIVRRKVIKVVDTKELREKAKMTAGEQLKRKFVKKTKKIKEGNLPVVQQIVEQSSGSEVIDKMVAERYRRILPKVGPQQQVVKVVVKEEETVVEEENEEWPWESEEEEPPIIQVKEEKDLEEEEHEVDPLGSDPTGTGTGGGAMEVDDEDNHGDPHRNCLLCYKAISKEESALAPVLTNDLNEQNFNSVFILRKMLNVPKEKLVGYLENFGCPGKWVEYCKNCLYLVDAALRIQKEINELEDKLRKCQEKMVQKIEVSVKKNKKQERFGVVSDEITRITEETRQFVNFRSGAKEIIEKVSSDVNVENDNDGPLESPHSPPPPSPPDDPDFDPSNYADDGAADPDEHEDIEPSSTTAKKPKLSVEDKNIIKSRARINGQRFLKTLKESGYTCSLCPSLKKPMSFPKFYRHVIFHHQRPFKCSICNLHWSSPKELTKNPFPKETHFSNKHVCSEASLVKCPPNGKYKLGGKIWNCKWCPEKFDLETERDFHEDKDHAYSKGLLVMRFNCLSCSKAYRSHKEWLLHRVLQHPEIAEISCLFCDFTAVISLKEGIEVLNLNEMKNHVASKHPACRNFFVSPETCDFCGIPFKFGKDYLAKHIKDYHMLTSGNSTYSCPCPSCHYRTGQLQYLKKHFNQVHCWTPKVPPSKRPDNKKTNEKAICDVCGHGLRAGMVLMEHKLRRHGIEPEDMSEYNGQKIWSCEEGGNECGGYRSFFKAKLEEHMFKKHGMQTRFKCEECGKGFSNGNHLNRHKEIHTNKNKGVKPYQCELCGNSFGVRNYLYIHMRLSHQNRPFASTNRKRTTKRGSSRMAKTSTAAVGDTQGSGVDSMGIPVHPPTLINSGVYSNGESVLIKYGGGDMDVS